jgi:transposase-like protein
MSSDSIIKSLMGQEQKGTLKRNVIIALRAQAGERHSELAKEFGMSRQAISVIVARHQRNRNGAKEAKQL